MSGTDAAPYSAAGPAPAARAPIRGTDLADNDDNGGNNGDSSTTVLYNAGLFPTYADESDTSSLSDNDDNDGDDNDEDGNNSGDNERDRAGSGSGVPGLNSVRRLWRWQKFARPQRTGARAGAATADEEAGAAQLRRRGGVAREVPDAREFNGNRATVHAATRGTAAAIAVAADAHGRNGPSGPGRSLTPIDLQRVADELEHDNTASTAQGAAAAAPTPALRSPQQLHPQRCASPASPTPSPRLPPPPPPNTATSSAVSSTVSASPSEHRTGDGADRADSVDSGDSNRPGDGDAADATDAGRNAAPGVVAAAAAAVCDVRRALGRFFYPAIGLVSAGLLFMFLGLFVFEPLPWQGWFTIAVVLLLLTTLVASLLPTHFAFLIAVTALLAFFVIDPKQALAGFSNDGVATVAVLFLLAEGVQQTSAMKPVLRRALGVPRNLHFALARLMLPLALLSAFLNNTPIVAMLIPMVKQWTRRAGLQTSRVLMPMNVACLLGGTITLIGTSTNLVVSGLARAAHLQYKGEPLTIGIFGITRIGAVYAAIGFVYCLIAPRWLLPARRGDVLRDSLEHPRQYTVAMRVRSRAAAPSSTSSSSSSLAGKSVEAAGLRNLRGLFLVELTRSRRHGGTVIPAVPPETVLQRGDVLLFAGQVDTVSELYAFDGLVPHTSASRKLDVGRHRRQLYEVVVSPFSSLNGMSVRAARFRTRFGAAILAVHRGGEVVREKIGLVRMRGGETLLVESTHAFYERYQRDSNFALVSPLTDEPPLMRNDVPHMLIAGAVTLAAVVVAATNVMSLLTTASIGVLLMIATRCMSMRQASAAFNLPIVLTIATSFGVANALDSSGAAEQIARTVLQALQPLGTLGILYGIYFATALLSEVITNNGAAALMFSIVAAPNTGIIFTADTPVNVYAALYALMLAASASFITPIGYQTNLMVHAAAGYRYMDWVRFGGPLQLLLGAAGVPILNAMFPSS